MKDNIIISDNTLSKSECDYLIEQYEKNGPNGTFHDYYTMGIHPPGTQEMRDILHKIAFQDILVDWCQIAKRPPGSGHPNHTDNFSEETVLTSVTYLNDNFTGGETYFVDDIAIRPKTGRTLYFDGVYREHGVHTVRDSARFTLAVWYKKKPADWRQD